MDLNIVMLQGRIGNDLQFRKTTEGATFATFTTIINSYSKDFKDNTEHRTETYIRVMCFDKRVVEYMQKVGAKQGNRVNVFARLNSHKSEYKGVEFIQNDVIARDVVVVKPKSDEQQQVTNDDDNNSINF